MGITFSFIVRLQAVESSKLKASQYTLTEGVELRLREAVGMTLSFSFVVRPKAVESSKLKGNLFLKTKVNICFRMVNWGDS